MRPRTIRRPCGPNADQWTLGGAAASVCRVHRHHWVILSVHVEPAQRRRGLATRLLMHIVFAAHAHGVRRVTLDNCLDNPKSRLYERCGFERVPTSDNEMVHWA